MLKALWGNPSKMPTTEATDVIYKRQKDVPIGEGLTDEEKKKILDAQDKAIALEGFEKLGVSSQTIEKLRTLDGLATSGAKFLSLSVTTSYQMFTIAQIHLFEETEKLRERLNDPNIGGDERLMLRRLYLDYNRELARGHQLQFDAAASVVRMQMAASESKRIGAGNTGVKGRKNKRQAFSEGPEPE